jgi:hypothetical protein
VNEGAPNRPTGGIERLAYELSLRALGQQEDALKELRSRTGNLLAASSVVASFLGARAIDRGDFGVLAVGALLAFLASILFSISILMPRRELQFALDGAAVFEYFSAAGDPLNDAHRTLAYWIRDSHQANQSTLDALFRSYRWACVAVAVEVVVWSVQLSDTLV